MSKQADLNPALGWPGGSCHVVERIEKEVRSPRLRENLSEKVEDGEKLTNQEAAKIYTMETERGAGMIKKIRITPHAQYRMDQRNVTVVDLRLTFRNFTKQLNDWKSRGDWQWKKISEAMAWGRSVQWLDPKLANLFTVFVYKGGIATLITTYWEGVSDPRPGTCNLPRHAAITTEDTSGYRTWVKNPSPGKSDTDKPQGDDGKYPTQGLPSPPSSRSKPVPNQSFNGPGESGSDSSGTVHKDKVRTKGTPGGQYDGGATHPLPDFKDTGITPNRTPGMTADSDDDEMWDDEDLREAGMAPPSYPGANRQRDQKNRAYLYFHKRYLKQRGPALMRQKRRHKKLKPNGRYQLDRKRRRETPERFERRPGGGAKSIAERSQKQRDKAKRQKSQKSASTFIPFFHEPSETWGHVIEVSPYGAIHFEMEEAGRGVTEFKAFFDEVILDGDDLDALFAYMDDVFEFPGVSGEINMEEINRLASEVIGTFFREQRPPEMDPDTTYNRGTPVSDPIKQRQEKRKPGDPGFSLYDDSVHDSNPGSRVLPSGKGHVEKSGSLIKDIREGCGPDLVSRSQGISIRLARADVRNAVWLFDVQGSADTHRVRLKAIRKGNMRNLQKAHVKVSCSCPFWKWQGPEHWAKQGEYLYGEPRGLASKPNMKDPSGQHKACKHVLAVLDHVTKNSWSVPDPSGRMAQKQASDFEKHRKRVAARYHAHMEVLNA